MGYEIRLHIGQEWNFDSTIGGKWPHTIQHIAMIDLSKPGGGSRIQRLVAERQDEKKRALEALPSQAARKRARTQIFTGVIRANREVYHWEDDYGMPLVSIPLTEIHEALRQDWEDSKESYSTWQYGYRRFYAALQLIEALQATFEPWATDEAKAVNPLAGQLVAIPWGH